MNLHELIELYRVQLAQLQQLLAVAEDKKRELIASNNEEFANVLQREEQLMAAIRMAEQKRFTIISDTLRHFGIQYNARTGRKLSEILAGKTSADERQQLLELETETRTVVENISKINKQNMFLLTHLRKFYSETIAGIMALRHRQTLIDRKV
ncbi:MAG: flagellar export chaperone FlgN [Ignavibacteriales bacterium]|nr:flagellar export chaperone FlgN [Ignavibacteriales bacterium]